MRDIKHFAVGQAAMSAASLLMFGFVYWLADSWLVGIVLGVAFAGVNILGFNTLMAYARTAFLITFASFTFAFAGVISGTATGYFAIGIASVVGLFGISVAETDLEISPRHAWGMVFLQAAVTYGLVSYFGPNFTVGFTVVPVAALIVFGVLLVSDLFTKQGRERLKL